MWVINDLELGIKSDGMVSVRVDNYKVGIDNKIRHKMKKSYQNGMFQSAKSVKSIISKSSLLTKKNPEENESIINPPYFKQDKMRTNILQRVSKSKQKENDHLDKASNIMKDLLSRHEKAKQKLQKLKEDAEKQYDKICPFTPTRVQNTRFTVTGDVVRRNEIWMREKRRKQLELKQEITNNSMRECTFSPKLSSKKQSESILKSRDASRSLTPKAAKTDNISRSPRQLGSKSPRNNKFSSANPMRRDFTEVEYEMAKRSLISKLMAAQY